MLTHVKNPLIGRTRGGIFLLRLGDPTVVEQGAAIILAVSAAAFTGVVVLAPVMVPDLGWPETIFLCGLFAFLCCRAFAVVTVQQRHVGEIERLSASRRAVLADTM
jgi:two-component system NarL family sensor kinase